MESRGLAPLSRSDGYWISERVKMSATCKPTQNAGLIIATVLVPPPHTLMKATPQIIQRKGEEIGNKAVAARDSKGTTRKRIALQADSDIFQSLLSPVVVAADCHAISTTGISVLLSSSVSVIWFQMTSVCCRSSRRIHR